MYCYFSYTIRYIFFFLWNFQRLEMTFKANKCRISSVKLVVKHFYSTRDRQKHDGWCHNGILEKEKKMSFSRITSKQIRTIVHLVCNPRFLCEIMRKSSLVTFCCCYACALTYVNRKRKLVFKVTHRVMADRAK